MASLWYTETTLEFAPCSARVNILGCGDHNLLLLVVVSGTFTLILGFLHGCFLVAFVQVEDDVSVEVLDLLLQVGDTLNPAQRRLSKVNNQFR